MAKNTGRKYEKLARRIFELILNEPGAKTIEVKHDVTLQGKTTAHQIDVYWVFEQGGIRYETIVQTKDYQSSVSQGEMFTFLGVLNDLPGQPRGVFVTRTGYQSGAKRLGEANGVKMYTLDDGDALAGKIIVVWPETSGFTVELDHEWNKEQGRKQGIPPGTQIPFQLSGRGDELFFYDEQGRVQMNFQEAADKLVPPGMDESPPSLRTYEFPTPTFVKTPDPRLPHVKVKQISATVRLNKTEQPFAALPMLILHDIVEGTARGFDKNITGD